MYVADFWKSFYIENWRFALDTLRVANRSPTPTSKTNDFLGPFDVTCGGPGPPFPADLGGPGGPGRNKKYIFLKASESQPR